MRRFAIAGRGARRATLLLRSSALVLAYAGCAVASPALSQQAAVTPAAAVVAMSATGVPAWGLSSSDLSADPTVRFGVLPNGMRYALKHNETPKGAAVIRFAIDAGMRESDTAQAGAAHFLEHMAFNGSTHIPEGELVKRLERLGLAFGADTNAETDLEHTTYKLDLPNLNPETVDGGLTFMREIASELTLAPAAMDRERGVLQSEFRVRNVPPLRRALDSMGKQVPNSRFGPAIVGTLESLAGITSPQLRAFYEGYYRPDRATLVMVGDFDVSAMEKEVRARFSNWQAKGAAKARYELAIVSANTPAVGTFTDPAVPEIIEFNRVTPYAKPANTVSEERRQTLEAIASVALSNRLNTLARKPASPLILGQAAVQDFARTAHTAVAIVVAKDGQWQPALAVGEQELRKAVQYGFTASEIAESKANIRTALENAVKQEAGRPSTAIADELARASLSNAVFVSPTASLALYNALDPTLTPEAASDAFRAAWKGGPTLIHVATKQPIADGVAAINSTLAASTKVAVAAPVEDAKQAFAYDDFGPPGKIASDRTIADLGIRTVRFVNGVELNLKKTDFEPGKIAWYGKVGSGAQVFPTEKPGLTLVTQIFTAMDGLKKHNIDELRRITAGRQVGIGLAVDSDGLVASGSTTQTDLDLQMKLVAAQLTDPAHDPATQAQWTGMSPVIAKNVASNPTQLAALAVPWILSGNDGRFGLGDPNDLKARTVDEMQAVLAPQLAAGGIEIGLVGDFDEDAAIASVAKSLAALPPRGEAGAKPASARPAAFTSDRKARLVYHDGTADQGAISLSWPTTDDSNVKDAITRDLLASVMELRLLDVIREKLGATYTPNASSMASSTYPGFGFITASAPAAQSSMAEVAKAIRQIATDLRAKPPSADEMLRARKPIIERWQRQGRENNSWAALVAEAQNRPQHLDRRRHRAAILEALVPADITAAAMRYLKPDAALEIKVIPRPAS
ncbi:MAG: insulinase family protein [Croceibacterium sp.]